MPLHSTRLCECTFHPLDSLSPLGHGTPGWRPWIIHGDACSIAVASGMFELHRSRTSYFRCFLLHSRKYCMHAVCVLLHRALHRAFSFAFLAILFSCAFFGRLFCLVSLAEGRISDFAWKFARKGKAEAWAQGCIPNGNLAQTGRTTRLVWAWLSAWHLRAAAST